MMKQNKLSRKYENELYTITRGYDKSVQVQDTKGNTAFVTTHMSRNISKDQSNPPSKDKRLHQSSETATLPITLFYIFPDQAIHNEEETTQTNA